MIKLVFEDSGRAHQKGVERISVGCCPAMRHGGIVYFPHDFGHRDQGSQGKECGPIRIQVISGSAVDQPENAIAWWCQPHRVDLIRKLVVPKTLSLHLTKIDDIEADIELLPFLNRLPQ